jgi:hypothetical protein
VLPPRTSLLVCLVIGVALEVGVTLATGRREAWDAGAYWTVGLPAAALGAAAVGYFSAGRGWAASALIVPAQVATMLVRSGSGPSLWPLTLALAGVLGLPLVGVAWAARRRATARR